MKLFVRNKKGSLNMSMEAIVILILAVVMLGLGLTFVRSMFANIQVRAEKAIDIGKLETQPDEANPVVFSPSRPSVKEGKQEEFSIGFYNPSPTETKWAMHIIDNSLSDPAKCGGLMDHSNYCGDGGTALDTIYNDRMFKLDKDTNIAYNVFIEAQDTDSTAKQRPILLTVQFCATDDGGDCLTGADEETYLTEVAVLVSK